MLMILSCWNDQYGHLDTLNVKIHPLFQILLAFLMEAKNRKESEASEEESEELEWNLIHIKED